MCGIVGFNARNATALNTMLERIQHRGPDDRGVFESDSMSLGHVRLSIIDLSHAGHQPMRYENLVLVYNGEVYNHKAIRSELEPEYSFTSDSDTEVVLKAFHKWGVKAVEKFIGMFAIALYDTENGQLRLFRDRVGVKPLYYFFDGESFVFASETTAIAEYKRNLALDRDALYEFFQFGYISSNRSIYAQCRKLPAGYHLLFEKGEITLHQYWSIDPFFAMPKFDKSEAELVDELEALLIDACRYRMVADVPVGVFLSGGIDSSVVAAILQRHHDSDIHTFTIGFKEAKYNEATYAKEVAEHLGTIHSETYLDSAEAKAIMHEFTDIYDEPFGDSSGIPTALVSRVAKEHGVKVVLSADGGDEIFCGYERYWHSYNIGKKLFALPYPLRRILAWAMERIGVNNASKLVRVRNFAHKYNQLTEMLKDRSWKPLYEKMIHNAKNYEIEQLLGIRRDVDEPAFELGEKEHPMQGMMLWDYHRYMSDDILVKVDRATMYYSIEGREPLLDHRIAEFMARVPFAYKYRDGSSKYLLRKVLERYIPKAMIERPKMGFGIPMFEWFSTDLRHLFDRYLAKARLEHEGVLNATYVEDELQRLKRGEPVNINKLWFILVFEMWHERRKR